MSPGNRSERLLRPPGDCLADGKDPQAGWPTPTFAASDEPLSPDRWESPSASGPSKWLRCACLRTTGSRLDTYRVSHARQGPTVARDVRADGHSHPTRSSLLVAILPGECLGRD